MRRPVGRLGSGLLVLLVPEISNRRGRERKDSARCSTVALALENAVENSLYRGKSGSFCGKRGLLFHMQR